MRKFATSGLVVLLTACGGGGDGSSAPATTATGYFKDSNTQGVRYVSGGQSGVTGADGSFTYEVGNPVTFSVGGVALGSVTVGRSVVTPVDLVASGATSSQAVQNLVRFLMMLDNDANPANGIQISPAVQAAAASWSAVNFDQPEANFTAAVGPIVTAANTADGTGTHALPTAATAQTHMEGTLRCARSGGFKGTYGGGDSGRFGFLIDAATGMVSGIGYSNAGHNRFDITGTTAVSLNQSAAFTSGVTTTGATYSGRMTTPDAVTGSWNNAPLSGTFSSSRVGGALNAKYRFTGQFWNGGGMPAAYGLYTFDINSSNQVTGFAYDVSNDTSVTLSGTVGATAGAGTGLMGTTSSGVSFTATINLAAGTVSSATWNGGGSSGSFTASGCQLN